MKSAEGGPGSEGRAILALILLPVGVKLHLLLGLLQADPLLLFSGLAASHDPGLIPGPPPYPTIDPCIGFIAQALGHRAALTLLGGAMPWWNHFEGIGAPLAGEMQSAAMFPPNLLLALPGGQLYMHILLQIVSGIATFLLLRRLGVSRLAAAAAGALFEFNGTFAWLGFAVVNPIPFLPVVLCGVETARARLLDGRPGGWAWIALGLALSLYAGFPEVAYLDGLLVAFWVLVRLAGLAPSLRPAMVSRVTAGLVAGLLLAAPILIAFLDYLPHAHVGGHQGNGFAGAHFGPDHFANLFLPYLFGFVFEVATPDNSGFWGSVGGYAGIGLVALAIAGLGGARLRALRFLLGAWVAVCWGVSYGVPGLGALVSLVPGVALTAFFRYLPPSWELALALLAAFAIDDQMRLVRERAVRRLWLGLLAALALLGLGLWLGANHLTPAIPRRGLFLSVALGAAVVAGLILAARAAPDGSRRARLLALVALAEAVTCFVIPTLSFPRGARLELGGIRFLQEHLGNQRFYSLGSIQANYGSFFGIAQANYNDLPAPRDWGDYVFRHLDDNARSPWQFLGDLQARADGPSARANLVRNRAAFAGVGVKYVVAPAGQGSLDYWQVPGTESVGPGNLPLVLDAGRKVAFSFPASDQAMDIAGVAVLIGNYGGTARGPLAATLCAGERCLEGVRELAQSVDNGYFSIPLVRPLAVRGGPLRLELRHLGEGQPPALWIWPSPAGSGIRLDVEGAPLAGYEPKFRLELAGEAGLEKVYADRLMDIYELAEPRPYVSAGACRLEALSRDRIAADCPEPAALTRLELHMPGWRAFVNGAEVPIVRTDELFQRIDLRAGRSLVEFRFRPPYLGWGFAAFALGCVWLGAGLLTGRPGPPGSARIGGR